MATGEYNRAEENRKEYSLRDIEGIGAWERKRDRQKRTDFTLEEAAAFMIDWHPAAYRNDRRKNQIAGLKSMIDQSVDRDGGKCCLMGVAGRSLDADGECFSKEVFYRWAQENSQQECIECEWFKDLRKEERGVVRAESENVEDYLDVPFGCPADVPTTESRSGAFKTRFKRLEIGSELWRKWRARNAYTIEELAYLVWGFVPEEDGQYIDERVYSFYVQPAEKELYGAVKALGVEPFNCVYALYGVEEVGNREEWQAPLFNLEAMDRFCYNKGYRFIFEECKEVPVDSGYKVVDLAEWTDCEPSKFEEMECVVSDVPVCDKGADAVSDESVCAENVEVNPESVEVCPGVTVKNIQEMIKDAPQLKDVFVALTEWRKETKSLTRSTLEYKLRRIARKNGANLSMQGHDKKGYVRLSRAQRDGLDAYFLPVGRAGKKKPYGDWLE